MMACLLKCDYFFLRAHFWERGFRNQKKQWGVHFISGNGSGDQKEGL